MSSWNLFCSNETNQKDSDISEIGIMDTYMNILSCNLVSQIPQVADIIGSREQNWTADLGFMNPAL